MDGLAKALKSFLSPIGWLWAVTLALVVLIGGSTRAGFLSDAILQLACLPLLLLAGSRIFSAQTPGRLKFAAVMASLLALPALVQLIPLPQFGGNFLPTQKAYAEALALTGGAGKWVPLTLDAKATMMSALALIPGLSIFFATLLLGRGERRNATLVLIGIGMFSVVIGIVQVAQGPASPLRFFPITNNYEAVGFFANRNHFAALDYVLLLFAAVWAIHSTTGGQDGKQNWTATMVPALGWFTVLVVLLAAQALTRSRSGLGLTILAMLGAFAMAMSLRRSGGGTATSTWMLTGALLGTLMLSGQFVLYRILERFGSDPLGDGRIVYARTTMRAAKAYLPFGSGFGTFVPVYSGFEDPKDVIANMYANHAHNDLLELWLESGFVGPTIAMVFLLWLLSKGIGMWRTTQRQISPFDAALVQAALMAALLLCLHSLVDYPLRTSALLGVMAFCCAMLIAPPVEEPVEAMANEPKRWKEPAPEARAEPVARRFTSPSGPSAATPAVASEPKERQLWGNREGWPETWTGPAGSDKPAIPTKPAPSAVWDKKMPDKTKK